MGIFATRNNPKLSREAMLSSRPARNELLTWEKTQTGEAQLTVIRQETWRVRLLAKVFYIPKERRVTLDEVGTVVWEMCDGRNTVAQMIESLSTRYQLNRKEAEVSLLSYLRTLGQKRFIGFLVDRPGRGPRGGNGKKWEKGKPGAG